jgi:hypothetical protein
MYDSTTHGSVKAGNELLHACSFIIAFRMEMQHKHSCNMLKFDAPSPKISVVPERDAITCHKQRDMI